MNRDSVIGLDIGGTHIAGVALRGTTVICHKVVQTPRTEKQFVLAIDRLVSYLGKGRVRRVGIGIAGVVRGTKIVRAANIHFLKKFDFKTVFGSKFSVKVDNDARAFLRSEWLLDKRPGGKSALGLTIGTGIGRSLAKSGTVKIIAKFESPEPWERAYQKLRDSKRYDILGVYVARKIFPIITRYRPDAVILGGGIIIGHTRYFVPAFIKELKRLGSSPEIITSRYQNIAGALGAALLFNSKTK